MSILEKLKFLIGNNELTLDFMNYIYEINKKPWCEGDECHLETWCDGAYCTIKFLNPIMEYYQKDVPVEQKNFFFIIHCLNNKKTFEELFKFFVW